MAESVEDPTPEHLEQELVELGLFDYCRPALERHIVGTTGERKAARLEC
jgi:hypothetical protein